MDNNHRSSFRDDDHEDDEKKMETFFSLIRSFREARDRRKQELEAEKLANKTRKLHPFQSPSSSSSSFERQDFQVTIPNQVPPTQQHESRNQEQEEEEEDDLNLKLSL
ncbi:hypothetical protein SSX86_011850 [Deinandra increscens subsp. villosa]|uniref:Protein NIM1-INTERACTING 1-like n=1 Tax=Deinandra increscens subsp. villosa TaxID=3103831 RepID=A0AAP0H0D7_9ASTR